MKLTRVKWLTGNIIDAAQALHRKAYHHIEGLEPVCLGQTLQFTVQRGEFVSLMCPTATESQFKILDSSLELSIYLTASQTIPSPLTQKSRLLQYCSVTKKKSNSSLSLCMCNMEMLTVKCLLLPLQQLMLKKKPYSAESPSQEVLTRKHD